MVNTLLGKIANFLEKEFLFAAFLPALLFVSALLMTLAVVIGLPAALEWAEALSAWQVSWLSAIAGVGMLTLAYVLVGLRSAFVGFWCGNWGFLLWGLAFLGRKRQRRRYRKLHDRSRRSIIWRRLAEEFADRVDTVWDATTKPAPNEMLTRFRKRVTAIHDRTAETKVRNLLDDIVDAFRAHGAQQLADIYTNTRTRLLEWDRDARALVQADTAMLDRKFGSASSIRATALGNVIASYNEYAFKRYNIEAEIFWPRLQSVIKAEHAALVREQRTQLDFCITVATLSAVYGVAVLLGGPWLWLNPVLWFVQALCACALSYGFYRLAISAAHAFGDLVRASFDLYRLDLMAALGRPHPETFNIERLQWEEVSELAVYGTISDFKIQPRKG